MKIKFELKEKLADKIFLNLEYMSGDADAYEYEKVEIPNIKFYEWKSKIKEIEEFIKPYKVLSKITDDRDIEYDDILSEYGEEIANLFDNVPGDSTVDHQWKSKLRDISLIAYDDKGNKYISYT